MDWVGCIFFLNFLKVCIHYSCFIVQSLSCVWLFVTPWSAACQVLCPPWSPGVCSFMSIEWVILSNHLMFCHPRFLLPSIFPSINIFSNESTLHIRWPKYWNCTFCIDLPNEYSGLISFRVDWFDLFAVQGTLKSLLQYFKSINS